MEKEICRPLSSFIINRTLQLAINKEYRRDLNSIVEKGHEIIQEVPLKRCK
jgi:hypothetical protein